ncbi:MAG TPA: DUF423 domain-containing protein, partial [Steroidobacteraceae bacterium]|nr:DUF423 domain-containing protein [Steroidobacteraceae bacterium]
RQIQALMRSGPARIFLATGALLLAVATAVGALAAHALKASLPTEQLAVLHTAVLYQFVHSLGLLAIGLLLIHFDSAAARAAGWLVTAGIILFCGSLYLLAAGWQGIGLATPLGGLLLILGWLVFAAGLLLRPPAAKA